MSEESGEKTEQPTSKKIRDAREKGQVAQSKELTGLVSMIVLVSALGFSSSTNMSLIANTWDSIRNQILHGNLGFNVLIGELYNVISVSFKIMLFPIVLAAVVSALANVLQLGGIVLSKEAFKFDFNRLNPISTFKNIFSLKNIIKFARQVIELIVMTFVASYIFSNALSDLMEMYYYRLGEITLFLMLIVFKVFVILLSIHLAFAIFDFIMEKRQLHKQLMMTMHEIKEEFKNTEGNPEIKQKQKEMYREMMEEEGFSGALSNTTMVLANPTHLAVLIRYEPQETPVPAIVGKARGEQAHMIFRLARKMGIPVVRDKWLTRKLYNLAEVGSFVPPSTLKDVADVIGRNLHLMPNLVQKLANLRVAQATTKPTVTSVGKPQVFK